VRLVGYFHSCIHMYWKCHIKDIFAKISSSSRRWTSLLKVLAFSTTSFHFPRSWTQAIQFWIFNWQLSCLMLSSHLYLSLPCDLLVRGFQLNIFLTILVSGVLVIDTVLKKLDLRGNISTRLRQLTVYADDILGIEWNRNSETICLWEENFKKNIWAHKRKLNVESQNQWIRQADKT